MTTEDTGYSIGFEELPDSDLNNVTRNNLAELFIEAATKKPLHLGLTRYLLRRAKQLKTSVLREPVLTNIAALTPAMREVIQYLIAAVKPNTVKETGKALLNFTSSAAAGSLPFVRMWILEFFIHRPESVKYLDACRIAAESKDSLGARPMALLARSYEQVQWVRAQKEKWANHAPWDRRAIIWASSILPKDERGHWCRLVKDTASDPLDRAVAMLAAQG